MVGFDEKLNHVAPKPQKPSRAPKPTMQRHALYPDGLQMHLSACRQWWWSGQHTTAVGLCADPVCWPACTPSVKVSLAPETLPNLSRPLSHARRSPTPLMQAHPWEWRVGETAGCCSRAAACWGCILTVFARPLLLLVRLGLCGDWYTHYKHPAQTHDNSSFSQPATIYASKTQSQSC